MRLARPLLVRLSVAIGVLLVGALLVWPFYWRMTPQLMARVMMSVAQRTPLVFPEAGTQPRVSTASEAGQRFSIALYRGRVAVLRSEDMDVTVIMQFPTDASKPGCRVYPAKYQPEHCGKP